MVYLVVAVIIILLIILAWRYKEVIQDWFDGGESKFVFFSADWCPHCRDFQSTWDELKKQTNIKFIQIPHTKASGYDVDAYPMLRFYPQGLQGVYIEYTGDRTTASIVEFLQ